MNDLTFPEPATAPAAGPTPSGLSHLALLRVGGADARSFLDAQLTRNVPSADGQATLAGYCSVKGRLLASFVMWTHAGSIDLLLSRDLAEAIVKRLKMYVLRAKVSIGDVTLGHSIDGLTDPASISEDVAALEPWAAMQRENGTWIRYPDADGKRRFLRIVPMAAPHAADGVDAAAWRWLDIRSGLPLVTVATQDRFVPQMLNLEALGGVDFKKGCYPGQEVVARSQYLGKLRRRMALASLDAEAGIPAPGTDVWGNAANEPAGVVVNAERGPDGGIALLIELPLAQFESDALGVGTLDGARVHVEPLPYPLPDNEVFVRPKL